MNVEAQVTINAPKEAIWAVVTNIENATQNISSIEKIEVLEKPASGIVGIKWRETRKIFGKTATEVMWITDAVENESYKTRAESHGTVYVCRFTIANQNGSNTLTMTHNSQPLSFMAKMMMGTLGFMFKGTMRKMILKDLNDIKAAVEGQRSKQSV
jgi:uncharacterized membrane protein